MDDSEIKKILCEASTIAVVGLSPKTDRPSHGVASFLKERGYKIIPVRPGTEELLGEKTYASLSAIPKDITIDIVDIFRRAQEVPPIVREAIERKTKLIWMQEGIINEEAAKEARDAGLNVIMDRCILKEHNRLLSG